jgi:hypothetical protein
MRVSADDPIAALSTPDDVQLMSVTRVAAALDCTERKARQVTQRGARANCASWRKARWRKAVPRQALA